MTEPNGIDIRIDVGGVTVVVVVRKKTEKPECLLCQRAVDTEAELEALPDGLRDDALEAAAASFFDEWAVAGSYAISQGELVQHAATSDEMNQDAEALGIPVGKLIPALQELFGLEKEHALRKAAVLRKYRRKRDDRRRTSILPSLHFM